MVYLLNYIAIALFLFWHVLWQVKANEAAKAKQKTIQPTLKNIFWQLVLYLGTLLIIAQLLGLRIWTFATNDLVIQTTGFLLVVAGILVSVIARLELSVNWTNAHEYQIKEKHSLITSGIYAYIRHPIYTGLLLAFSGAEILAESYLVIPALVFLSVHFYLQGKKEEKILLKHFGSNYTKYLKKTKMFIPYFI